MAGVRFEGVTKRFGAVEAVRELSLDIADGEFMVLVGPSGSGKTTALRMLAGLEAISDGNVWIGDRDVSRVAPRERDIAMVFQDYALYPQWTVFDNLAFGLRRRRVPKDEIRRRVTEAARVLDLEPLLARRPGQLSGGQAQRVALGRALVREPQVFLMDEPLSNLDAKLRTQTRGEIRRLVQEVRTTTVYVTHDQVEAMTMGDRIAVLNEGRLEQVGTPAELYEQPANRFVASFIGSPAMSFIEAPEVARLLGAAPTAELASSTPGNAGAPALPVRGASVAGASAAGAGESVAGVGVSGESAAGAGRVGRSAGGVGMSAGAAVPEGVVVGVRPEHARLWREGLLGPLDGTVAFVESLGRETFVGVDLGPTRLVVFEEGRTTHAVGDPIRFGLVPSGLRYFDATTGAAIPALTGAPRSGA